MSAAQQSVIETYKAMHPKSAALYERARGVGGVCGDYHLELAAGASSRGPLRVDHSRLGQ